MPFDHNDHYHRLLLRQLPKEGREESRGEGRRALDIGCGTGRFARRLAGRGYEVDALDPSPSSQLRSSRGDPNPRSSPRRRPWAAGRATAGRT
ncbi:class I SAM-dependent methyltransferase [Streptomyces sp. NPDC055134]